MPEEDFDIFQSLLNKRPEINSQLLKKDLKNYYIPFVEKLIELKKQKRPTSGFIVGVSAIQGVGKTTQGEILEILLKHMEYSSVSLSIDDHYITHRQLNELRAQDPRFVRRGVTHDIPLAIRELKELREMVDGQAMLIAGYDKGANKGDGERFRWVNPEKGLTIRAQVIDKALQIVSVARGEEEIGLRTNMGSDILLTEHVLPEDLSQSLLSNSGEVLITSHDEESVTFFGRGEEQISKKDLPNGWRVIYQKPDFIFYDGWMLGAKKVEDESVFDSNLPALETKEAREFAKFVNIKLENYNYLWQMLDFMNVLYVPDYKISLKWRDQAEEVLRTQGKGMSSDEIREFVYYFWRSVHPAIHIKALATDPKTDQVVIVNDDHTIKEVLTPDEVRIKYQ